VDYSSVLYWVLFLSSVTVAYLMGYLAPLLVFPGYAESHPASFLNLLFTAVFQGVGPLFIAFVVYYGGHPGEMISLLKPFLFPAHEVGRVSHHETIPADQVPELLGQLRDPKAGVSIRAHARGKLEKVGPEAARFTEDIVNAMNDEGVRGTRYEVSLIKALGRIGPDAQDAVEALGERLQAVQEPDVSRTICSTLRRITGEEQGDRDTWLQWFQAHAAQSK
jgi:hypothetical protein